MEDDSHSSACVGKKVYLSFADADRACDKVASKHDDVHLMPYRCQHCQHWHTGNKAIPPTRRDDIARKRWKNWSWWKEI